MTCCNTHIELTARKAKSYEIIRTIDKVFTDFNKKYQATATIHLDYVSTSGKKNSL